MGVSVDWGWLVGVSVDWGRLVGVSVDWTGWWVYL